MDLQEVLDDHKLWVKGIGGKRADLRGADLREAELFRADLFGVYLSGAYLREAYIDHAKGIRKWQSPCGVKRAFYSVKHTDCVMHKLGCFWGTTEEAVAGIRKKYGENSLYEEFLLVQVKALEQE